MGNQQLQFISNLIRKKTGTCYSNSKNEWITAKKSYEKVTDDKSIDFYIYKKIDWWHNYLHSRLFPFDQLHT